MKNKLLLILLSVIFLISVFASCDNKTDNTDIHTDSTYESNEFFDELTPTQNNIENQSLTIYTWYMDNPLIKSMLAEFQKEYPEIKINYVMIEGNSWDYTNKLSNDLAAGDGPDLFMFTPDLVRNLSKLIQNNVFADLDELNKRFNKIDYNDYNKIVFDSGLINGKRYFVPFDYSVPLIYGVEETLEKYNIMYKESTTLKEFAESTLDYYDPHNHIDNRYVFACGITQYFLYRITGTIDVNMFAKEWTLNEYEMSELYEVTNILYPEHNSILGRYNIDLNQYTDSHMGALLNENILFYVGLRFGPSYISTLPTLNTLYDYTISNGKIPILTTIPNISGSNEVTAYLDYILAINENSKNKEAAYNAIADMLGFDTQFTLAYTGISTGTPINNAVFEYGINWFKENPTEKNDLYPVHRPYTDEFVDNYRNIINSISKVFLIDANIGDFMGEESYYIEIENKSISSAVNDLKNKIKLYIQE